MLLLLIITNTNFVYSQIIAGSTVSGLIISNPVVNFSVSTVFGNGTGSFDLDCDSIADIRIDLHKGPTAIDASNNAFLYILNSSFQVCADTANTSFRFVNYFSLSDTILPPAGTNWYNDSIMQLGDYGCFDCQGPFSVTNLYFGYKNSVTSQVGWVKFSFNLIDGGSSTVPITLSIPEVLSPCVTTSVSPAATSTSTPTYTNSGVGTCGAFTFNYNIYRPSCPGMCDANISISNVTGGSPAYTYSWNTAPVQTTSTNMNVCSGTSMVDISDASGNTCTANFLVQNPPQITFSLSSSNVSCYGVCDGTVCCNNVTGGNAPYTFECFPTGGTTQCANSLCAGTYGFIVTDANGCIAYSSVLVNEPTAIQVTESVTHASCVACCDGNLQLQISGGTPAYSINYFPAAPSCPGTYTYNVTDSKGCTHMDSVLISFATSLIEHEFETMFDVFPNPGNGQLEIMNLNTHIFSAKVEVVDIYGKCVFSKKIELSERILPLNLNVAEGIYFLHISETSSSKEFVKKIVILDKN